MDYPPGKRGLSFLEHLDDHCKQRFFDDADHAHDKKTRRSVTGILAFVGCTFVLWRSSRQSSIACSTMQQNSWLYEQLLRKLLL